MSTIAIHPAASANYMALITSRQGTLASDIKNLRSRVIHLEPTLSYSIAWAGYENTHKLLHTMMQSTWERLKSRHEAMVILQKVNVREVRQLKSDVELFGELIEDMGQSLNNLKGNKMQFEMEIHESVVEMVRLRWELEWFEF
jgi:predicted  nucleic acid-binding Zn-ribbon protein